MEEPLSWFLCYQVQGRIWYIRYAAMPIKPKYLSIIADESITLSINLQYGSTLKGSIVVLFNFIIEEAFLVGGAINRCHHEHIHTQLWFGTFTKWIFNITVRWVESLILKFFWR